ncbi:hypothetical protein ASPZODRAFT_130608 [Penicilliopsis zonata CBS 506.65]|uniref:Large ribosomal subunit protein bL21m n=1 Tax=Penicilliopsis zonata CBS 506.65 TaxID=1073090 RepID=A0A1L9SN57_9EURO|nr:hypothetical protein ASPZODRAFT_130608 [Penicilliopsis zonata CBS 506.65]OJJ48543.1 hypothetical protein ASPZODRAFT_130608 [Penicilliopsis zonata CBS 506.65]
MFSRSTLRLARWTQQRPLSSPSLSVLLPQRACLHQSAAESQPSASPLETSSSTPAESVLPPTPPQTRADVPPAKQPIAPQFDSPVQVTQSLLETLPYLTSQGSHYISAHLHDRPYLVTEGDHVRLPFKMPKVKAGDIIRLNRASVIGSRDFTLKGAPYLDERLFECRARVLGVDAEPMTVKEKTKRRQRHVRKVKSKHKHTLMRIMELRVKTPEELLAEGAVVMEHSATSPRIEVKA